MHTDRSYSPIWALALFGALHAVWSDVHPVCDQIVQRGHDAQTKGEPGPAGRAAAARHVASYTLVQAIAAELVTRGLGYRVPARAMLVGHAINAVTHYVIDRRRPLLKVLRTRLLDKTDYLEHATVQRRPGVIDAGGPGTALYEIDQAAHRIVGVTASAVTTWLAVRTQSQI
ncbi:hypothetical protein ACXJJ3_42235 (plasmid) [Kribbella sp. WER1]